MAVILNFLAIQRSSCSKSPYQAYRFAPNGTVRSTLLIEAENDVEAAWRYLARKAKVQRRL